MKFLWKYLKKYQWMILLGMGLKLAGTLTELLIPYVMEHLLDHVVPQKETAPVLLWGGAMILLACVVRFLNVTANRKAVWIAKESIFTIRRDLPDAGYPGADHADRRYRHYADYGYRPGADSVHHGADYDRPGGVYFLQGPSAV